MSKRVVFIIIGIEVRKWQFLKKNGRSKYDRNKEYIMSVGRMMAASGAVKPNLQFKITAFMSGDLVVSLYQSMQLRKIDPD